MRFYTKEEELLVKQRLFDKGAKSFSKDELCRIFDATNRPALCKRIAADLVAKGLTIESLNKEFKQK